MLPHVTGFSSAPNRGARKVFAQAVGSGLRYLINPSAARALECTATRNADWQR